MIGKRGTNKREERGKGGEGGGLLASFTSLIFGSTDQRSLKVTNLKWRDVQKKKKGNNTKIVKSSKVKWADTVSDLLKCFF